MKGGLFMVTYEDAVKLLNEEISGGGRTILNPEAFPLTENAFQNLLGEIKENMLEIQIQFMGGVATWNICAD